MKPLAIDLYCGLGGWAEGFLAEGYRVIGFDIERHDYGTGGYPGELVLQDVTTLHGSQFREAAVIVASPPCQAYSYRAMPWSRAKALPPPDNSLFEACFRIQAEASEAAGRYIPLIVENVKGAQKWVGRARWHFGSFYLWGDVPALMPTTTGTAKVPGLNWSGYGDPALPKMRAGSWFAIAHNIASSHGQKPDGRKIPSSCVPRRWEDREIKRLCDVGVKQHGVPGPAWWRSGMGQMPSKSSRRKAASAHIAKIPFPLAQHIARCFYSEEVNGPDAVDEAGREVGPNRQ